MEDMLFDIGDKVTIVVANSNFFGWVGEVVATYNGDFVTGEKHYRVKFDYPAFIDTPSLLFNEHELAYAG